MSTHGGAKHLKNGLLVFQSQTKEKDTPLSTSYCLIYKRALVHLLLMLGDEPTFNLPKPSMKPWAPNI